MLAKMVKIRWEGWEVGGLAGVCYLCVLESALLTLQLRSLGSR